MNHGWSWSKVGGPLGEEKAGAAVWVGKVAAEKDQRKVEGGVSAGRRGRRRWGRKVEMKC